MSEYQIGHLATFGLLGVTLASWLYMLGGRSDKIIRRLGGAFVLAATANALSKLMGYWSPWQLLILPALFGGFSLGYDGESLRMKVVKRFFYATAICSSGLILCLTIGGKAWLVLPVHMGVGVWSVWLGVKNPLKAAAEEVFVCALLNIGLMMYLFV